MNRPKEIDDLINRVQGISEKGDRISIGNWDCVKLVKYIEDLESNLGIKPNEEISNKLFKCLSCGKRSQVKKITAIQTYNKEDGGYCIGDQYTPADLDFKCPKCGVRNRLLPQSIMSKYRIYFKEIIDEDREVRGSKFVNYFPGGKFVNEK